METPTITQPLNTSVQPVDNIQQNVDVYAKHAVKLTSEEIKVGLKESVNHSLYWKSLLGKYLTERNSRIKR